MLLTRLAIFLLGSIGFFGVGSISLVHWNGESSCPTIGSLPACYLILVGYGLILFSLFIKPKAAFSTFLIGWVPVISLALMGVAGDLTSTVSCPSSDIGIPKCYFSAALSVAIGLLYWKLHRIHLK